MWHIFFVAVGLGLAPRLARDDFRAAFTASEGSGRRAQSRANHGMMASIQVDPGTRRLRSLGLMPSAADVVRSVRRPAERTDGATGLSSRAGEIAGLRLPGGADAPPRLSEMLIEY